MRSSHEYIQLMLGNIDSSWIRDRSNCCENLASLTKPHQVLEGWSQGKCIVEANPELEKLEVHAICSSSSTSCSAYRHGVFNNPSIHPIHPNSNLLEVPARYA